MREIAKKLSNAKDWKDVRMDERERKKKRELDDARFKALQQMIENAKDDPIARSELVNKLF